jgi:hypothetical protein
LNMKMLLGLLFLSISLCRAGESNKIKYYYIPFNVETYEAVTTNNIQDKAEYKGEIAGDYAVKIVSLLMTSNQSASFERKRVRLLIENQYDNKIFVDASGTVLKKGYKYNINDKKLIELNKILRLLIKQTRSVNKS